MCPKWICLAFKSCGPNFGPSRTNLGTMWCSSGGPMRLPPENHLIPICFTYKLAHIGPICNPSRTHVLQIRLNICGTYMGTIPFKRCRTQMGHTWGLRGSHMKWPIMGPSGTQVLSMRTGPNGTHVYPI